MTVMPGFGHNQHFLQKKILLETQAGMYLWSGNQRSLAIGFPDLNFKRMLARCQSRKFSGSGSVWLWPVNACLRPQRRDNTDLPVGLGIRPYSSQRASTKAFTSADMTIGSGQSRVKPSARHLRVASM